MSLYSSSSASCFLSLLFFTFMLSNPPSSSAQKQQKKSMSSFSISDSPWRPEDNKILLSPNSVFAAGFQPLPETRNLFTFSVWYYNISVNNIVWSANYKDPVNRSAALVTISSGQLRFNGPSGENFFNSTREASSTKLSLGDNGNLVYGKWESFDYPTNTILPNQTINSLSLLSSKNEKYKFVESKRLVFNGSECYWNTANAFLQLDYAGRVIKENQDSFFSSDFGETKFRKLTLNENGNLILYSFDQDSNEWIVTWQAVYELCRIRGACGPNYICTNYNGSSNTQCECPPGYKIASGNGGEELCNIKIPIDENPENSKFLRLDYVNFTDGSNQTNLKVPNYSACKANCLKFPNCLGFLFKYDGNGYCVLLLDRLLYGYWSPGSETATFLRVNKQELEESSFSGMTNVLTTSCPVNISLPQPPQESNSTTRNIVIICTLFAAELISGVVFFWTFLKKYVKYRDMAQTFGLEFLPAGGPKRFSYAELKAATGNFSNIIGRGGFGDVYKGELSDHRVVAVKCLKNVSTGDEKKGLGEFWAEVTIIARMHHLNLVRLWGFCAEKGHRILVYEYVPNGSLDKFLFNLGSSETEERKPVLDWNIRYRIAVGVARAIAYLHEECLEWVLHRDIKPENILLGDDFCPKVSDFGLAKLKKKEKENVVNVSLVQGTPGYMAPEWAKSDTVTPKADVYSFGMVLLELVSGVRNREIQASKMDSEDWYFPRWVFDKVFKEMNVEDILDIRIKQSYDSQAHFDMVNRMVKTAIWCLQDRPEMRPSMGKVTKMLEGTVEIIEPKKPTIFFIADD